MQHAQRGEKLSLRPSSVRNGLFMKASIAAASGPADNALSWFEAALSHPYEGQARYGLVRFAAFLAARGETTRAADVTRLARERDPQSALEVA
jgi:hypothetical protein